VTLAASWRRATLHFKLHAANSIGVAHKNLPDEHCRAQGARRLSIANSLPKDTGSPEPVSFDRYASNQGRGRPGGDSRQRSLHTRQALSSKATLLVAQQDRLLNLRLADDIDQETFAQKQTELRDRLASIKLQLDVVDRSHDETSELAAKVFELSQTLRQQWLTADYAAKRRILEIILSNCTLVDATLVPVIRKPFDVLAEGLVKKNSGGGGNRTRVRTILSRYKLMR